MLEALSQPLCAVTAIIPHFTHVLNFHSTYLQACSCLSLNAISTHHSLTIPVQPLPTQSQPHAYPQPDGEPLPPHHLRSLSALSIALRMSSDNRPIRG